MQRKIAILALAVAALGITPFGAASVGAAGTPPGIQQSSPFNNPDVQVYVANPVGPLPAGIENGDAPAPKPVNPLDPSKPAADMRVLNAHGHPAGPPVHASKPIPHVATVGEAAAYDRGNRKP